MDTKDNNKGKEIARLVLSGPKRRMSPHGHEDGCLCQLVPNSGGGTHVAEDLEETHDGIPETEARAPLDVFHKYADLSPGLQFMIWQTVAATQPRVVCVYNRYSGLEEAGIFGFRNRLPRWFMTCDFSAFVASCNYKELFAQPELAIYFPPDCPARYCINPATDIVVFEPCKHTRICKTSKCSSQHLMSDRAQVRFLALETETIYPHPTRGLDWKDISDAWPNVETLYLMKTWRRPELYSPVLAMLRMREDSYEVYIRFGFNTWKKNTPSGQSSKLNKLEFVVVVPAEPESIDVEMRYETVRGRKTGRAKDIIVG